MQRVIILLGVLIATACSYRYSKDPIPEIPSIDQKFLDNSITYLDKMIQKDPTNLDLYKQKLNIYRDQNWPTESITSLNTSIELDSSNLELVKMRKDYYLTNGSYRRALLDIDLLIKKGWESKEIGLEKAITLNQLNRTKEVWETIDLFDLDAYEDSRLFELKGDLLLDNGDSLLSLRNYYLYFLEDKGNKKLNRKLIDLLVATGSWKKAIEVLDDLSVSDSSYLLESAIARINTGQTSQGLGVLRSLSLNGDRKALNYISEFYIKNLKYDSVIYFNNHHVNNFDSINTSFNYIAKAYDKKGWWTRSLMYYDLVLQTDSTNEQALLETEKVKGKIAYLRKLKEEKERTPVNIIIPKKKIDF